MDEQRERDFFERLHHDDLIVFGNPGTAPRCGFVMEKQPTTKKVKVLLYPYKGDTLWIGDRTVLVMMNAVVSVHRPREVPNLSEGIGKIEFDTVDMSAP